MRLLITERLRMEPLTAAHAAEMFSALSDPTIYPFIPGAPPQSVQDLESRYQRLEVGVSPDGSQQWLNWIIRPAEQPQCVGFVQATLYTDHTADFAFVLTSSAWGKGWAYEASHAALQFLFIESGVSHVFATADPRNTRSIRLLQRLEFQPIPRSVYPRAMVDESDYVCRLQSPL